MLDVGADIPGAVVMRVGRRRVGRGVERAPAFRGEEELVPAVAEVAADQFLAAAVIGRGVDQVNAAVEDRVQQAARVFVRNLGTALMPLSSMAP